MTVNENGKMYKVLIENSIRTDPKTGVEIPDCHRFYAWADKGLKEAFENIEGVDSVYTYLGPTQYIIEVDHRYDTDFVKREVEAVAMCA